MAPGTALRSFLSHHQPEKQRFQRGPQPPEVLWNMPRAAGLQAGRCREASSFLSPSAGGWRERGVPGAGTAGSRVGTAQGGHSAGCSSVSSCFTASRSSRSPVLPALLRAFSLSSRALTPPKLGKAPGCRHHPSPTGTPAGRCGASEGSEGSVPPPSLLPALPGAGAGGGACSGLWEPQPGRPCRASRAAGGAFPRAGAGASALQRELSKSSVPGAEAALAGSTRPPPRPRSRGQGAARGSPARETSAPSGLSGPFRGPRKLLSPCTSSPAPFPKEGFWERAAAPSPAARAGADGEECEGTNKPRARIMNP